MVGFPVVLPKKRLFNEMVASMADVTPAVVPALRRTTRAVQIKYGYKKGGIGVLYEMPIQTGLDAVRVFRRILRSGTFVDRDLAPGWTIKAVPDKKLLLAVSGTSVEVQAALVKAIGK